MEKTRVKEGEMKVTELMIGDWVTLNGVDYKWQWTHHDFTASEFNTLEPIPLTPEILEKNGFEFVDDSIISISAAKLLDDYTSIYFQFCNNNDCYFQLHHYGAGSYEIRKYVKYVYELQHALRLCGLNELADNFIIE